ncbi:abortive infection system toxin AbiGii family protein [Priestia megaterium]|uniref:abortive infection system toxin AbiGii family protein n=1 Tax=Priestia megaterium TaxID=1404 RepID=UPI00363C4C8D
MGLVNKTNKIEQKNADVMVAVQDSDGNNFNFYNYNNERDYVAQLLREEKMDEVGAFIKNIHNMVGQAHPFSPHYVYKAVPYENKIVFDHAPINEQAAAENPLVYKGKFKINKKHLGEAKSFDELLTKSMIRQQEIEIDVEYVETWIGNTKLENDQETLIQQAAKTAKWFIPPEELPPPMKVKLVAGNVSILDYIELNIGNIDKDKRETVLDNSRQTSCPLLLMVSIKKDSVRKKVENGKINESVISANARLMITLKGGYEGSVKARKLILEYLLNGLKGEPIKLVVLETGNDFVNLNNHDNKDDLTVESVEHKIEFFNLLLKIEDYFNFKFEFFDEVTKDDAENITTLKSIVEGGSVGATFTNWSLDFTDPVKLGKFLELFEDKKGVGFMIAATMIEPIEVFGQSISNVRGEHRLESVTVENLEKVKRKQSCMDQGDLIKVNLVPGVNNKLKTFYTIDNE